MSRPRSRSPSYRLSPWRHENPGGHLQRIPWDGPDFDPHRRLGDLGRKPFDGKRHHREDPNQPWTNPRDGIHPGGRRRSPHTSDTSQPAHFRHSPPEEFWRRSPPPPLLQELVRRRSPQQPLHQREARGRDRGRGGLREDFLRFEDGEGPSYSPLRLPRERLPPVPLLQLEHLQRHLPAGWRKDGQGRGQKRPRDLSPVERFDVQGRGQGRDADSGNLQGPYRERRRDDLHRERSPFSESHRERDIEDAFRSGYRKEEVFRDRHRSPGRPTDGFGDGHGDHRGTPGGFPQREGRASETLVVDHGHGKTNSRRQPHWETFGDMRNIGSDHEHEHHLRQRSPSHERIRRSNSRPEIREEARGRTAHDNRRVFSQENRSPIGQDGTPMSFPNRAGQHGPLNHRERSSPGPARGRGNPERGGRMEVDPVRNHAPLQQFTQGHKDTPQERHRPGFKPREGSWDMEGPSWAEETPENSQWEGDRPGNMGRRPPRDGINPGMPRNRESSWNSQRNTSDMADVSEETLTIKVDMNRHTNQNSQLCYSSDRQLSLDLVNVGRQRLDFLPMLEHSGTYQETPMHTGKFAQEIIQLLHQVKEHYFKGDCITLNQRFSAPQEGALLEEEEEEDDPLEERPTLNRRFNMNMSAFPDPEPLFSRLGPMEDPQRQDLVRDPADLRHDLERRRQERLEGVKVTIAGGGLSQRPHASGSENSEYGDEDGRLSDWPEEQGSRWPGGEEQAVVQRPRTNSRSHGPRRGGPFRPDAVPQRRNNRPPNRLGNRTGPVRRQNNRNNVVGGNW